VAALADKANEDKVRRVTIEQRKRVMTELKTLGYETIPSETNFFMVHLKKPVVPVIAEFRKKGVIVVRPFPPLNESLRVSIGTPDEMAKFMVAFKEIMSAKAASNGS